MKYIKIHPLDNVAVALQDIDKGDRIDVDDISVTATEPVKRGHKIALKPIPKGSPVIKYGNRIGIASADIEPGSFVHVHNVKTALSETGEYKYEPVTYELPEVKGRTFMGYRRAKGKVGIRNELWIIPTVGCVNSIAERLVRENQHLVTGEVEGLYTYTHPFGCSQMGDDHETTKKVLAALVHHPNAGGVLVLSLGCENLTGEQFKEELREWMR